MNSLFISNSPDDLRVPNRRTRAPGMDRSAAPLGDRCVHQASREKSLHNDVLARFTISGVNRRFRKCRRFATRTRAYHLTTRTTASRGSDCRCRSLFSKKRYRWPFGCRASPAGSPRYSTTCHCSLGLSIAKKRASSCWKNSICERAPMMHILGCIRWFMRI